MRRSPRFLAPSNTSRPTKSPYFSTPTRDLSKMKGERLVAVTAAAVAATAIPSPECFTPVRQKGTRVSSRSQIVTLGEVDPIHKGETAQSAQPSSNGKKRRRGSSKTATDRKNAARTESFGPMWAGSREFLSRTRRGNNEPEPSVEPHTLILGTHPSIASLGTQQYYGHPMNAFWWIAGDCLGFRRGPALTKSGKPYKFASSLRYGPDHILSYEEQLECMVSKGFAMWDVVASCKRPGSLDQDIREERPNDIRAFCEQHPTVRRLVFANGGTGSRFFVKHFGDWLASGDLVADSNEESQKAFGSAIRKQKLSESARQGTGAKRRQPTEGKPPVLLISAASVSPAAARLSYEEKRQFWDGNVYAPGLADFERMRPSRDP